MNTLAAYLLGGIAIAGVSFWGGLEVQKWHDDSTVVAERDAQIADLQERAKLDNALIEGYDAISGDIGTHVVEYRDRISTKIITLTREVPVYVTPAAVKACVVPRGFILYHNNAASNSDAAPAIPDTSGGPVDADSHVGIDTVSTTIAANYGTCNVALKNEGAWQEWYAKTRAEYEAWSAKQNALHK